MNILVNNSDTSSLGGGGIPPRIDTKTITTGSVPDFTAMMAQNAQIIAALGSITNCQPSPSINESARAARTRVAVNYWRQWIFYFYKCGGNLRYTRMMQPS